MDMDEMVFYSLDEQAIKQEIAYKKENLPTTDILFSFVALLCLILKWC